jgi:hypothetical protein
VAKTHHNEARKYKPIPAYNGGLRPKRSSSGPYKNCPNEIPIKKLDNERATCGTVVFNAAAMAGKAGRYISIEKGPIAESNPNIRIVKNFCLPSLSFTGCKSMPDHGLKCE